MKKGGIEVLNALPNSETYASGRGGKNEFEDYIQNFLDGGTDDKSVLAQGNVSVIGGSGVKKSIRGGASSINVQRPVIRGGGGANKSQMLDLGEDELPRVTIEEKKLNYSEMSIPPSN
jgi:hypothetical protein